MNELNKESSARPSSVVNLKIGGFIPTTTVDYPGHLAAVIFTLGCPWRCGYCHNYHLIDAKESSGSEGHDWSSIYALLKKRRHLLDGVVISGGEPLIQPQLPAIIDQVKQLGYKVALHTNGVDPNKFAAVLPLVDWVGMDIKGRPEDYPHVTGVIGGAEKAFTSLDYLLKAGVDYEIRTTVHWSQLPPKVLLELARLLAKRGVTHYVVQLVQVDTMLDSQLGKSLEPAGVQELWAEMKMLFDSFEVRDA